MPEKTPADSKATGLIILFWFAAFSTIFSACQLAIYLWDSSAKQDSNASGADGILISTALGIIGSIFLCVLAKSAIAKLNGEATALGTVKTTLAQTIFAEKFTDDHAIAETAKKLAWELENTLRREKAVIERAVDVICIIDINGKFTSVSRACINAWGYEPQELEGRSISDMISSPDSEDLLGTISGASKSIDKIVFDCQFKKKNGEVVFMVVTGHWSVSEGGFYCIMHDITERKQLEALKRDFMAMISHDIKTPLSSMEGLISLLQVGAVGQLNDQGQQISAQVKSECGRIVRLINDLLDIDRIESGKFSLDRCHLKADVLCEKAIDAVKSLALKKEVNLTTSKSGLVCFADEQRIMQVLINLLSNAIKFSPEKSSVQISIKDNNESVKVEIVDQGQGIPAERIDKIFEKFERIEDKGSATVTGHGLGLAICKAIIDEHGGEIGVTSLPDRGSTFWFTLPKDDIDSADYKDMP